MWCVNYFTSLAQFYEACRNQEVIESALYFETFASPRELLFFVIFLAPNVVKEYMDESCEILSLMAFLFSTVLPPSLSKADKGQLKSPPVMRCFYPHDFPIFVECCERILRSVGDYYVKGYNFGAVFWVDYNHCTFTMVCSMVA